MKLSAITSLTVNETVSLRILDLSDSEAYFDLIDQNREYLREWLGWVDGIVTVEDAKNNLRSRLIAYYQGQKCLFGLFYQDELVGRITFSQQIGEVNIGYFVAEAHQGKGIESCALDFALQHGFSMLGVYRFVLTCQDKNHGSKAIATRLGFQFEGIARHKVCLYGNYFDLNVYSLIKNNQ